MPAKSEGSDKKQRVAVAPEKKMTAKEAKEYLSDMEGVETATSFAEPAFQYKIPKTRKLHPDERTWTFLQNVAAFKGKKVEAAALLGVTPAALTHFFGKYPEAGEAWERGRALRKFHLRTMLTNTASSDPATLRFIAKNELGMTEGAASGKTDISVNIQSSSPEDRLAKLEVLQSKVIDITPSSSDVEDAEVTPETTPGAIDALIQRSRK